MFELETLKREADEIVSDLSKLLGSDFPPELVMKLFEAAMGPTQMRLYSVSDFMQKSVINAEEQEHSSQLV